MTDDWNNMQLATMSDRTMERTIRQREKLKPRYDRTPPMKRDEAKPTGA